MIDNIFFSFLLNLVAAIFFCLVLALAYVWLNGHLNDDPDNTTENWLNHLPETTETRRGTESSLPSTCEHLKKVQLWNDTATEISDMGAGQYKSMSYHFKPINSAKKTKYQYQNGNCKLVNAVSQDGQLRTMNTVYQDEHPVTSQENASLCLGKTCGEIGEHFIQVKVRDGRCISRRETVTHT